MPALPLNVLIIEDNPNDAELVLRELRRAGYHPVWARVQTKEDFLAHLGPEIDLILSDYDMPNFSGPQALILLQERNLCIPFIIISGTIGEDVAVEVMRMGATDYLLKDRLMRLGLAIGHALDKDRTRREHAKMEGELNSAHKQLQRLLDHSPSVFYSLRVEGQRMVPQLVSENITRLLGFSVEQASNYEWWSSHLHPEDRDRAFGCLTETLERGGSSCEYRIRHELGPYVWIEDHMRLILDHEGKPVEIAGTWIDITERKRAGAALQRQQTELRVLFDLMPAMVWFKDTNNGILRVNQRVAEKIGKSVAEIEGRPSSEIYPEEAAKFYADDLEVIHSGVPKLGYVETVRGMGCEDRWMQTDKVPYCDERGKVIGIVVMAQDITERIQAEEALRQSQKRLRDIIDGLGPSVFVGMLTLEGILIEVNHAPLAAAGLKPEEVIGKPFVETYWWNHSSETQQQLRDAIARAALGQSSRYDVCARGMGTAMIDVDFSLNPLRNENGEIVFLISSAIVITDRKRAEMEVRFNEQRFRSLVEATTAIVWDTPASGHFETPQPSWTAFTGQSFNELRGTGWLQAIHPEDKAETGRVWTAAVANRSVYEVEHRLRAKDQTYHNMAVRAVPILGENGAIHQWIGIHIDITESKKLEQQFLRAQRMESIGTLAGGIAHDLNNVLAPIMMSIDLLKIREADPMRLSILSTIASSAKRGADMVQQVLSFARGMEGLQLEVKVGQLLHEVEKISNDTFLKNIQVRSDIPCNLWSVQGDPTQLHQVLLNLCVNARDAMPQGGMLSITAANKTLDEHYVSMNLDAKPGPYVLMEITDTGMGMPAAIIERIFDPFFTTKELGKGTGLGLSTTLAIVKSHAGFVRVQSEVGKGTKFEIYLPAKLTVGSAVEAPAQASLPQGQGELILVVDDEAAVRQITQQTLEAFGYRVLLAADGADAAAIYAAQHRDIAVVLTDMMMPVMDGLTTIHVLMRINPKVLIIAASGLNADGITAKAATAGVKHFIPKPYTAETLLKMLHSTLHG